MSAHTHKPGVARVRAIAAAVSQVAAADADRTAITLSAADADIWVSDDPNVTVNNGLRIVNGTQPFTICRCNAGDWVCKQLFGITGGGTHNIYVVEGFDEPYETGQANGQ